MKTNRKEKREERVGVPLTAAERNAVRVWAARRGQSMGRAAREVLLAAAGVGSKGGAKR